LRVSVDENGYMKTWELADRIHTQSRFFALREEIFKLFKMKLSKAKL